MTTNQLARQKLELEKQAQAETQRSNLAKELETNRSNLAKEAETVRANRAKEDDTDRARKWEIGKYIADVLGLGQQARKDVFGLFS